MEERHKPNYGEKGLELPYSTNMPLSLNLYMFTDPEALQTLSFWDFMEASLQGMTD